MVETGGLYHVPSQSYKHSVHSSPFQIPIIVSRIQELAPNVQLINYVTDGGPSHFKNRRNILNLTFHDVDFEVPGVWSFSATSHGKGPVDGLGAALKSTATRYLLRHGPTEAFKSAKGFYEFSKQRQDSTGNPIELLYVRSEQIMNLHRTKNAQRWSSVNGTWSV